MWEQKGLQKCSKRCLLVFVGWCGKVAQGSTAQQDQTQHWELGVGAGDPGVELGNGAHENNKQDGQPCKLGGLREQRVPPDAPGVCGSVLLGATDRWSQSLQLRGAQAPGRERILVPLQGNLGLWVHVSYLEDALLITQVWPRLPPSLCPPSPPGGG